MDDFAADSEDMLTRLRQGDLTALTDEFSRHRERLGKMIAFRMDRRLRGRVDADDVLQEAFLAAEQRIDHYCRNPSAPLFVWLRQIAQQTLIDVHRRHMGAQMRDAGREVPLQGVAYPQTTSVSLAGWLASPLTSPSEAAMREEAARQLEAALATMDAIDQEVLALRHFEELTNSEVAAVLGIQQKAASIRYVRALARLKEIMSQTPGLQSGGGN